MMNCIRLAASIALWLAVTQSQAQGWPQKPVHLIVGFAPGGTTDLIARPMADRLTKVLGQTVLVENKAGGTGVIAAEFVAKAAPDGYTILISPSDQFTIVPHLQSGLRYQPAKDFALIMTLARGPILVLAHPSVPASNLKELVALAKAHPGKYGYATSGTGTGQHLTGELLKDRAGIDLIHIPYKGGGQAISDLVGGQVPLAVLGSGPTLPQVRSGKIKAIGLSTISRLPSAPDIPTLDEQGLSGFDTSQWFLLAAPAGTPGEIVARVNKEVTAILNEPEFRRRLLEFGMVPAPDSPQALRKTLDEESALWAKVIRDKAIKAE
jgi:tripartite-type tricarboxylate transporter receptor subunit TctC